MAAFKMGHGDSDYGQQQQQQQQQQQWNKPKSKFAKTIFFQPPSTFKICVKEFRNNTYVHITTGKEEFHNSGGKGGKGYSNTKITLNYEDCINFLKCSPEMLNIIEECQNIIKNGGNEIQKNKMDYTVFDPSRKKLKFQMDKTNKILSCGQKKKAAQPLLKKQKKIKIVKSIEALEEEEEEEEEEEAAEAALKQNQPCESEAEEEEEKEA
jgi:hypothetical protein